jgi:hypothetical protein
MYKMRVFYVLYNGHILSNSEIKFLKKDYYFR